MKRSSLTGVALMSKVLASGMHAKVDWQETSYKQSGLGDAKDTLCISISMLDTSLKNCHL